MREILFRGKQLDTGTWLEGNLRVEHFPEFEDMPERWRCLMYVPDVGKPWSCSIFEVAPETVGQYTGCTDRMGERIFEGDILAFNPGDGEETSHYLVKWDNARWTVCTGRGYADDEMIDWESEYWTVIGNIYDNPELIGGTKK